MSRKNTCLYRGLCIQYFHKHFSCGESSFRLRRCTREGKGVFENTMNIIDNLLAFYNASPENDIYHDAVLQILDHLDSIRHATIYQMAAMCYVSPSTISRLCRKLGCENYAAFRDEILHVLDHYDDFNRIVPTHMVTAENTSSGVFLDHLSDSIQSLHTIDPRVYETLADVIHSGTIVGIYASSNYSSTAILQNTLVATGQKIRPHNRRSHQKDTNLFKPGSVVIFQYPYFSKTMDLTEALKECHKNGATTIAITTSAPSSLSQYADYFYNFDGCRTVMDNFTQDFFMDMVIMAYREKYIDRK